MDAEQIVRGLAASDPGDFDTYRRLAREWCAANPEIILATASAPLLEDDPPTS